MRSGNRATCRHESGVGPEPADDDTGFWEAPEANQLSERASVSTGILEMPLPERFTPSCHQKVGSDTFRWVWTQHVKGVMVSRNSFLGDKPQQTADQIEIPVHRHTSC